MNESRLETVIGLLRELDRMEQEKIRDGNAEQPWWYMRDAFATTLRITFEEIPDYDSDENGLERAQSGDES